MRKTRGLTAVLAAVLGQDVARANAALATARLSADRAERDAVEAFVSDFLGHTHELSDAEGSSPR